jgi:tetratricopeptide (TPR) repeat protein
MKSRHLLPLLAAALPALLASAFAAEPCNETCKTLLREGQVAQSQGQNKQAYDKFRAASSASPGASAPASAAAALFYQLSTGARPEEAGKLRASARDMATQAARLAPDDPVAQEVLRLLDDDAPSPLHVPAPAVLALRDAAETLFAQGRYADALAKYEAAMRADPQYSMAWIGAGDCWFMQKEWARAENLFRRAAEIEPRNAQAWRFLSDALLSQGKAEAADAALVAGIAADPSQRPGWSKLAALRARAGHPLAPLQLRRGSRVVRAAGGDGKDNYSVTVEDWVNKDPQTPDAALRLTLALAEANTRKAATGPVDAYAVELEAWRTALKVAGELEAGTGKVLGDPALVRMQALARDGQLEPAILLLQFRQAYRPALEAWNAAHPGGVKAFIDRYGLQP